MRVTKLILACLAVSLVVGSYATAQEGFPLKGSWLGDFGPNATSRTQVFVVMDWDGKSISGMINPGTDNIPIRNATLTPPPPPPPSAGRGGRGGGGRGGRGGGGRGEQADAPPPAPEAPPPPMDWLVHFEAEGKTASGGTVRYVVDGVIENIGIANRSIVGTWTSGNAKNSFRLTRQ